MKHGRSNRQIGQMSAENVYLVQFRVQAVATVPCQGVQHQPSPTDDAVSWQIRMYQNTERLLALVAQGVEQKQANQRIWEEACREQDTIGVRVHFQTHLCSTCLINTLEAHAGKSPLMVAMLPARLIGGAFLLVAHRKTENAGILAPFPVEIDEKDILASIRELSTFNVRLKEPSTDL